MHICAKHDWCSMAAVAYCPGCAREATTPSAPARDFLVQLVGAVDRLKRAKLDRARGKANEAWEAEAFNKVCQVTELAELFLSLRAPPEADVALRRAATAVLELDKVLSPLGGDWTKAVTALREALGASKAAESACEPVDVEGEAP